VTGAPVMTETSFAVPNRSTTPSPLADVGDEFKLAPFAESRPASANHFSVSAEWRADFAIPVEPTEVSGVLGHRPTRLQIPQTDEVMNLLFLRCAFASRSSVLATRPGASR